MKRLRVVIAGGGIGGLSAALSLASKGIEVHVLEQAAAFTDVGAGIQLSPNATRVLFSLGLEATLEAVAFTPVSGETRDAKTGNALAEFPLGRAVEARFGFPFLQIHRHDLIALLAEAARAHRSIMLDTNSRVTGFEARDGGVCVLRADQEVAPADALIGADGVHSVVREALFGPESPRFTGNIAWRALIPAAQLPAGLVHPKATVWWGAGRHFVHYYVRRGELVNCVCVVEKTGWEVESWSERGEFKELKAEFAGWHKDIQTLINAMDRDSLYKWALFDRPPMAAWGRGRVSLLGDACHPTLPFMAQGAAMAIEDGAVLARCLSEARAGVEVPAALERYSALRRARTAHIQKSSMRSGRLYHMRGLSARLRNVALRARRPKSPWDGIYSYNALLARSGREP